MTHRNLVVLGTPVPVRDEPRADFELTRQMIGGSSAKAFSITRIASPKPSVAPFGPMPIVLFASKMKGSPSAIT